MDDQLRRLERQAAAGDYVSRQLWKDALARAGFPDPDEEALKTPLTEWEDAQKGYDEQWWHGNTARKCGLWGRRSFDDVDFKTAIFKAHHDWGHRGWNNRNSKRKTLRTHRNGSRKNHRLKSPQETEAKTEAPHERRRKKRFGGRKHRRREYSFHPVTGRFRAWWEVTKPDLDE